MSITSPIREVLFFLFLTIAAVGCDGERAPSPPLPAPPRIISISPSGILGLPGKSHEFSAEVEGDIVAWEWQFPAFLLPVDPARMHPRVEVIRPDAGIVRLVVRTADGQTDSHEVDVNSQTPGVPGWHLWHSIPAVDGPDTRFRSDAEVIDGLPMVLFSQATAGGRTIHLARPQAPVVDASTSWLISDVGVVVSGQPFERMKLLNLSNTKIGAVFGLSPAKLAVSNDITPLSIDDWTTTLLPEGDAELEHFVADAAFFRNRIAFISTKNNPLTLERHLFVYQATTESPANPSDFTGFELATSSRANLVLRDIRLLADEALLACAFMSDPVEVGPAADLSWASTTDSIVNNQSFQQHALGKQFIPNSQLEVSSLRGNPLVVDGDNIYWATIPNPGSTEHWQFIRLPRPGPTFAFITNAAVDSGNRLALFRQENTLLGYRAINTYITGPWELATAEVGPLEGNPLDLSAVALPDERIFVVHHPTEGVDELRFLLSDGPW